MKKVVLLLVVVIMLILIPFILMGVGIEKERDIKLDKNEIEREIIKRGIDSKESIFIDRYDSKGITADSLNTRLVGSYDTGDYARHIYVSGDYAYVADNDDGLRIISVSDPMNPTEVGYYDTGGYARDVYVVGNYAYIGNAYYDDSTSTWKGCLYIIDVSDATNPQEVGYYDDMDDWVEDVYVVGDYAYIADGYTGLYIIDISDPTNPSEVGYYNTSDNAKGVYVVGDYVYVANGNDFRIIDALDPSNPTEIGYYDTGGYARDVYVVGDYAYVADDYNGLRIIDISDPTNPVEVGYYGTYAALGVYVLGNYAYVADSDDGLRIIDISDPANLNEVGYYDTGDNAQGVYVIGDYAYVADWGDGLYILCFEGITLTLNSFNGGEICYPNDSLNIVWEYNSDFEQRFNLLLSYNGTNYNDTIAAGITDTTYLWRVPYIGSDSMKIKVELVDSNGSVLANDVSDSSFSIVCDTQFLYLETPYIFRWTPEDSASFYTIEFNMDTLSTSDNISVLDGEIDTVYNSFYKIDSTKWNEMNTAVWEYTVKSYNSTGGLITEYPIKRFERMRLKHYGENGQPIVLLHGWRSNGNIWVDDNNIIDLLKGDGYDPWVMEYPNMDYIEHSSAGLDKVIDYVLLHSDSSKVDIMAHSMGGLIARSYSVDMAEDLEGNSILYGDNIRNLVMLGTPNQGSPFAILSMLLEYADIDIGKSSKSTVKNKGITDISPATFQICEGSAFLSALNSKSINSNINHMVIMGYNPALFNYTGSTLEEFLWISVYYQYLGLMGPSDGVVATGSAYMDGITNKFVNRTHWNIYKINDSGDEVYNSFIDFVNTGVENDLEDKVFSFINDLYGILHGSDLKGASIRLSSLIDTTRVMAIISDNEGEFNIPYLPADTYLIKVDADGYNNRELIAYIDEEKELYVEEQLVRDTTYEGPVLPNIMINGDASFTDQMDVELNLSCENAEEMMISNNTQFDGGVWQTYGDTINWTLTDSFGLKSVFVKFRNSSGIESSPVYDIIRYGSVDSTGTIVINTNVDDYEIYVDNIKQVLAGDTIKNQIKDEHRIIIKKDGYRFEPVEVDTIINQGDIVEISFNGIEVESPSNFNLISPANNAQFSENTVEFEWAEAGDTSITYILEIDTTEYFTEPYKIYGIEGTTYSMELSEQREYYWRVIANNEARISVLSDSVYRFEITDISSIDDNIEVKEYKCNINNFVNNKIMVELAIPENAYVRIDVYDVVGRNIGNILNGYMRRGNYRLEYPINTSGIYFVRVKNKYDERNVKIIKIK